jgi:hypothetical protein
MALSQLRLTPAIEVAEAGEEVWLRGRSADEGLSALLQALPAKVRYEWRPPDGLRQVDQRIPCGRFPNLQWQPLHSWLLVDVSPAALPANIPIAVPLRLKRSGQEHEPNLLLTRISDLRNFASQAARVRLERLTFAAAPDGRVLVRGNPLPSVPGLRFVLHEGVGVPAGFAWVPAVSKEVLARRLGASAEALVLWHEDGTISRFHSEQFVAATLSAVLATERALTTSA